MSYNALIRTHHITSRKKIAALKQAAFVHDCFVLLRSGGSPGIMYVEAKDKGAVEAWVNVVRNLRYKDFQLVTRPGALKNEHAQSCDGTSGWDHRTNKSGKGLGESRGLGTKLHEVGTVKEFGSLMEKHGIWGWWRKGMGYVS
ncbi:hypothetical protein BDV25DRAFT_87597 [Aspergillus avenaceus]|uniref:Uncharacterized protein n=1 Tax=Aspergillus avenaceus TaxID=36643 RepID=A0A5N6TEA7_ASPAV|nr:hypothetical protein BDV25DRAFT_87597 [Aspergillus avenaceus]